MTPAEVTEALDEVGASVEPIRRTIWAINHGRILIIWWDGDPYWVDIPGDKVKIEGTDHLKDLCQTLN